MKKLATKTLILLFVFFATTAVVSAQVNTLYYMKTVSTRHELNPAFQSIPNVYVQIPGLGFYAAGGNNSLMLSDIVFPKNGELVTFLHPDYGDKDKLYDRLKNNTHIFAEAQVDLLGFGFRVKEKNFFTFGIAQKAAVSTTVSKDLFKLGLYGMPDTINTNVFDFKSLNVDANVYTELALGYSRNVDKKLTIGGKAKFLLGQANVKTKSSTMTLETSRERWIAHVNSEANVSIPFMDYVLDEDGWIDFGTDKTEFKEPDNNSEYFKLLSKPSGFGAAIDLGASYYMLDDRLHLSASVLDLGYLQWSKNTVRIKGHGDIDFEGLDVQLDDDNEIKWEDYKDKLEGYKDSLKYSATFGKNYGIWMPTKVMFGVEYGVLNNKITFGVLSKTIIANQKLYEEITTSVNFLPAKYFNTTISYSWMNGRFNNFGLGIGGRIGPVNLYVAGDYVPMRYSSEFYPTHTQQVNVRTGIVLNFGYREDDDKDGVINRKDKCPDTPLGVKVDKDGCPLDSDGDGVPDYLDLCPDTPLGVEVDENGCPLDSDGDGVPDYLDECPDTPKEAWGTVDERGCPKDSDGDGVPDYLDECPDTPLGVKVDERGCPPMEMTYNEKLFEEARHGIQFETGKDEIKTSSFPVLDQIAEEMKEKPQALLQINGHTDNVGSPKFNNQALSERRAAAVKNYLVKKGIAADRITTQGFGDTKPLVPNTTDENKALNRRVEFVVSWKETVPAG